MYTLILTGIAIYLTCYTFLLSKRTWKEGNKPAAVFIMLMAGCFLPLTIWINMK